MAEKEQDIYDVVAEYRLKYPEEKQVPPPPPDGWDWVRGKITTCCPWLIEPARSNSLRGTAYEVMGWLHILCATERAARVTYVQIAVEQQRRVDLLEAELKVLQTAKDRIHECDQCVLCEEHFK